MSSMCPKYFCTLLFRWKGVIILWTVTNLILHGRGYTQPCDQETAKKKFGHTQLLPLALWQLDYQRGVKLITQTGLMIHVKNNEAKVGQNGHIHPYSLPS